MDALPCHRTLYSLLRLRAQEKPESTFIICDGSRIGYSAALAGVDAMAASLLKRGIREGSLLVHDAPQDVASVFLILAASRIGARLLMLNQRLNQQQKDAYLDGQDTALVVDKPLLLELGNMNIKASSAAQATDATSPFLELFTSGSTGRPKLVPLTQEQLVGSSQAVNERLGCISSSVWQVALPLYHVGGFQMLTRTLLAGCALVLYARFDAELMLEDASRYNATHVSVVDAMLCDLLDLAGVHGLQGYSAILLGGGSIRHSVLERACGAPLFVSYGMTEASSTVAMASAADYDHTGLIPLSGYTVSLLDKDEEGFGEIGITGPGVFSGYVSEHGLFDRSHFEGSLFRTGDRASARGSGFKVQERLVDLIISGGENIAPNEIEAVLSGALPKGADLVVAGVPSARWGRVPAAFISGTSVDVSVLRESATRLLPAIKRPVSYVQVGEVMRNALGKVNRKALGSMYDKRVSVSSVEVRLIDQPLSTPFVTANGTLGHRESLIVRVFDSNGNEGVGECTSFSTPWYMRETIPADLDALTGELISCVLERDFLTGFDVEYGFNGLAPHCPQARSALETACWDLYGAVTGRPLREIIGGVGTSAPAGCVLGIASVQDTLAATDRAVRAGFKRVKLKIVPGNDYERVKAVRRAFPELQLMVDANQSYSLEQAEGLRALNDMGLICIEEPLSSGSFGQLARLQDHIDTPICLDESYDSLDALQSALAYPQLRMVNMKIGKFGGLTAAMNAYRWLRSLHCEVWMGGMLETSISKRLHAIFETIPGITIPGDVAPAPGRFPADVCIPPTTLENGFVSAGEGPGLGLNLDIDYLDNVTEDRWVFER